MKRLLTLLFVTGLLMITYARASAQDAAGLLAPVGGGYADVYPGIVAVYLERAHNDAVTIVVIPTTYSTNATAITAAEREVNLRDAERRRFELEEACKRAAPKGVRCTATLAPIFTRADAEDPDILKLFDDDVTGRGGHHCHLCARRSDRRHQRRWGGAIPGDDRRLQPQRRRR
jgi:hypothetical protein